MTEEIHILQPLITDDSVIFGILMIVLTLIFKTSESNQVFLQKFYKIVPSLLLCYFIPSILTSLNIIKPYWYDLNAIAKYVLSNNIFLPNDWTIRDLEKGLNQLQINKEYLNQFKIKSQLYFVASRYLLPASLILLTLSINIKDLIKLGPKAGIMFLTGTIGVIIGGPLSILLFHYIAPNEVHEELYKGMATIAGSWIGGGANQAAMYEIFKPSANTYSIMVTIDIIVAEIWMAFLLYGVGKADKINKFFKADTTSIDKLKFKMHEISQKISKIPTFTDIMVILGLCFGGVGLSHFFGNKIADFISENIPFLKNFSLNSRFFWLIIISTSLGFLFSLTKLRNYEGAGGSKFGGAFIYILIATIGMKMNILEIFYHPILLLIGLTWMAIHVLLLIIVAKIIHSSYFYLAVGSKANIGGAASAPVVAAAFHPSLAPVGVILAVLGYALGTYGAWLCGIWMQFIIN